MRIILSLTTALALLALVGSASLSSAQTQLRLHVVGSGGGTAWGGASGMRLTTGQAAIGVTFGGTQGAEMGFWYPLDLSAVGVPAEVPAFGNHLYQNVPNPFNPSTTLRFSLTREERVQLDLFDPQGHRVASLVNETLPAGEHSLVYRAEGLSSGIYLLRLKAGDFSSSRRLVLLK